jgi:glucose/arabinose dehydrogenase/PKD repeat protein
MGGTVGRKAIDEGRRVSSIGRALFGPALLLACLFALGSAEASTSAPSASASTLPPGFQEEVVFNGLTNPTAVRFAADGRVFVAEKSGLIKVFDSLSDPTPTIFADLRTNVYNFWDRGLLGLALHPNFPATPYVYVLYTYDHMLGSPSPAPRWGTAGQTSDPCPDPPGANSDGCVASARLSRLQASGNTMVGQEQVLIEDWCQQYPSHSIGDLQFGPDGALYASAGEGASFSFIDWGQDGSPPNPCGDPPSPPGTALAPPTAEGGSLRSQDLRTSGDPVGLDGTLIRVDDNGAPLPSNPLFANPDSNAKRIIAYGLRNPFRFTFRPGTNEMWIGDVGGGNWEEINQLPSTTGPVLNFGWPCYEGPAKFSSWDNANLNICENLYADPSADTKPYFTYHHNNKVVAGESCPVGSSSISGLSFEFSTGTSPYPPAYKDALFFADYSRKCIWVMKKGTDGKPAPGQIETFVAAAGGPVDLERGRDGLLYYVDFDGGTIRRIVSTGGGPSNPYSTEVLADSPAVYWRLGEASGNFADSSGHGLDGSAVGTGMSRAAPDLVSSNSDRALTFTDGTTYVNRATLSGLSATSVTAEAWVKPTANANWIDLANHGWGAAGGWALFTDASGNAHFGLWSSSGAQILASAPGVQPNVVNHIVGTYDGTTLKLYLNGTLVSTRTSAGIALNTTGGLYTGRTDTTSQATIDEVAVYPTALSQTRVQAHYNASFGGGANQPPTAIASANPTSGTAPLTVTFNGTGSTDPDGDPLTYAWDLDGDGAYDDSTAAQPNFTYTSTGSITVRLKVTDPDGAFGTTTLVITVTASGGTSYAGEVLTDAPAVYWRLGEANGNFADSSGHGLDGTAVGTGMSRAAPDLVSSNSDHAVTFTDGTTYVNRATLSGLSATSVTAEAWVKPTANANWIDLANHNWGSAGGWALFTDASGNAHFGLWSSTGAQILVSAPGVQANVVNHVVGTYDGTTLKLYLNGTLVGTRTSAGVALNTTAGLYTGRTDTASQATIDEVAVYPTALSQTRVQAHFAAAQGGGGSNLPPTASITSPTQIATWRVGTTINFAGGATDPEDGTLPASALDWEIILHHCPSNCHTHIVQTFEGVASGSFAAPDHEYPSFIEIRLTATDSGNLSASDSVELQPRTVTITLQSAPTGLQLSLNSTSAAAPFTQTVIEGSNNSLSAPNQTLGGTPYTFTSWSDSGAQSHNVTANTSLTLTANFAAGAPTEPYPPVVLADTPKLYWRLGETADPFADSSGNGNAATASGTGLSRGQPDLVAGDTDHALTFTDGTSSVACASPSGLPSSAVSVELWFRTGQFANYIDLASHNWGGSGGSGWAIYTTSNRQLSWGLWEAGSTETSVKATNLSANTTYHVVGTYDGNIIRLYLNGRLVTSRTVGAKTLNTSASVLTGRTDTTAGVTVDEFAVYGTALSTARVQAHYASGT